MQLWLTLLCLAFKGGTEAGTLDLFKLGTVIKSHPAPLNVRPDVLDVLRELILLLLLSSEHCWLRLVGLWLSPTSLGGHASSDD